MISVVLSGSSAREMAPRKKYGLERLEEAVKTVVEARKAELKSEFGNALGADFELNCRPYLYLVVFLF